MILCLGYSISSYDSALFICHPNKDLILLLLFVDDMIITTDGIQKLNFSINHLRWKILATIVIFLAWRSFPEWKDSTPPMLSINLIFYLKLVLLTVRLLIHLLSLMHIWSLIRGIIFKLHTLLKIDWHPDLSYSHSSKHFLWCTSSVLIHVYPSISPLYCFSMHFSIS